MFEVGSPTSYAGLPLKSMVALCELLDRQPNEQTIQTLAGVAERLLQGQCLETISVGTLAHALRQLDDCLDTTTHSSDPIEEVRQRMRHLVAGDRSTCGEYRSVRPAFEHVLWLPDIEATFARENSVHGGDWANTTAALSAASRTHALTRSKQGTLRYRSEFTNAPKAHGPAPATVERTLHGQRTVAKSSMVDAMPQPDRLPLLQSSSQEKHLGSGVRQTGQAHGRLRKHGPAASGNEDGEFIAIPNLGIAGREPSVPPGRGWAEPPHQSVLELSGNATDDNDFPDTEAFDDDDEVSAPIAQPVEGQRSMPAQ